MNTLLNWVRRTLLMANIYLTGSMLHAQTVSADFIFTSDTLQNLNGYNLAGLHGIFDCNYAAPSNAHGYQVIDDLEPELLRFPGGTISQYAHVLQGSGYGLDSTEITADFSGSALTAFLQLYADEQQLGCRYVDMFLDMYSGLSKAPEVLYVANITTASIQENIDVLNFLITNNVNVVGVELGNEAYRDTIRYPQLTAYLNAALPYAQAMAQAAPFLEFGWVAAPPLTGNRDVFPQWLKDRITSWNPGLSAQTGNALFDGVVIHHYANDYVPGTLLSYQNNYDNNDLSTLNPTFAYATGELVNFVEDTLEKVFQDYRFLFGNNVDMWVTEWGPSRPSDAIGNTLVDAALTQMWADGLNRINALLNGQIKYACRQKLAGPNTNAANMISPKGLYDDTPYDLVRRTSYWSMFLRAGMEDRDLFIMENTVTNTGVSNDVMLAGYLEQNGEFRIHYVNLNPSAVSFDLSSNRIFLSNGTPLVATAATPIEFRALSGSSIYSSAGETEFLLNNVNFNAGNKPPFELDTVSRNLFPQNTQNLTLPPFSIGTVRYGVQLAVSIDERSNEIQPTLFPNPAVPGQELFIAGLGDVGSSQQLTARLFDLSGSLVWESSLGEDGSIAIPARIKHGSYVVELFQHAQNRLIMRRKVVLVN